MGQRHMKLHQTPLFTLLSIVTATVTGCPADDSLDDKQLSALTDDEYVEVCEDITAELSADAIEGWKRIACGRDVDCTANPAAYEDCAAAASDDVLECDDIPDADAAIRDCAATAGEFNACFVAFFGETAAWADFTCDTAEQPETRDISEIAECDDLRAVCPDLFEDDV